MGLSKNFLGCAPGNLAFIQRRIRERALRESEYEDEVEEYEDEEDENLFAKLYYVPFDEDEDEDEDEEDENLFVKLHYVPFDEDEDEDEDES